MGVYYGFKLGHTIPWVDGFPFNVVSHPQYVGSVATVVGMAALVSAVRGRGVVVEGCGSGETVAVRQQRVAADVGMAAPVSTRYLLLVGVGASLRGSAWQWGMAAVHACIGSLLALPAHLLTAPSSPTLVSVQVWTQAPAGLGVLVAYWTGLYVATAFQESKLHVD